MIKPKYTGTVGAECVLGRRMVVLIFMTCIPSIKLCWLNKAGRSLGDLIVYLLRCSEVSISKLKNF